MTTDRTRHDRADPRLLGDAPQLGGLDRPLRGQGLHGRSRPPTRASRSRSRRSTPTRRRSRQVTVPADHRAPRGGHRRPRRAADPHGPLGRRRVHADPARPRLRRRRRGHQLGADRGRQGRSRSSQIRADVPGAEEPGQPPPRRRASRSSSGTTPSPTRSARRSRRRLYERYHIPASGPHLLGQRAGQHPARPPGHLGRLQQRRRARRCCSSPATEDHLMPPTIQQSNAKHYKAAGTVTEVKEYAGPAPAAVAARAGRRSPTTPSSGRSPTPAAPRRR